MPPPLQELAPDLWVATRPLRLPVGDVGARMSIIRLPSKELVVHSPVPLDRETREAVDELGRVQWVVGPNLIHSMFLQDWTAAYPEAILCGAPGLAQKRSDLPFSLTLPDEVPSTWPTLEVLLFEGMPGLNEIVFYHQTTRTLILTDLSFNRPAGIPDGAWLFHRLVGAHGRFGPHRLVRFYMRDKNAAARSVQRILQWPFDRVIVSHGVVLESGGKEAIEQAFRFLPNPPTGPQQT